MNIPTVVFPAGGAGGGGGFQPSGNPYSVTFNFRASDDREAGELALAALRVLGGTYDLSEGYVVPERHSDRASQRLVQAGGGPRV